MRATALSYFARLADADTIARQVLGDIHHRGVEAAGALAAMQDGAPWLQRFTDLYRPDALRAPGPPAYVAAPAPALPSRQSPELVHPRHRPCARRSPAQSPLRLHGISGVSLAASHLQKN
jgi:hypothetical protein